MKKTIFTLLVGLWSYPLIQAQGIEYTTYYGERKGFRVDLPDDWGVGLEESTFGAGMVSA